MKDASPPARSTSPLKKLRKSDTSSLNERRTKAKVFSISSPAVLMKDQISSRTDWNRSPTALMIEDILDGRGVVQ